MTTATSLAGLVPLAWGSEPGAAESWRTLAVSAGAGLFASSFFSLTFLPCVFHLMTRRRASPAARPVLSQAGVEVS
jgi:Cu/Ag efflux pump CusA